MFSSKGTRDKKKMFLRDYIGSACHFFVCVEYIITTVNRTKYSEVYSKVYSAVLTTV